MLISFVATPYNSAKRDVSLRGSLLMDPVLRMGGSSSRTWTQVGFLVWEFMGKSSYTMLHHNFVLWTLHCRCKKRYMSYLYRSCLFDENCPRLRWSKMSFICAFCMLIFYGSPFRTGKIGWESESIESLKTPHKSTLCFFGFAISRFYFIILFAKGRFCEITSVSQPSRVKNHSNRWVNSSSTGHLLKSCKILPCLYIFYDHWPYSSIGLPLVYLHHSILSCSHHLGPQTL